MKYAFPIVINYLIYIYICVYTGVFLNGGTPLARWFISWNKSDLQYTDGWFMENGRPLYTHTYLYIYIYIIGIYRAYIHQNCWTNISINETPWKIWGNLHPLRKMQLESHRTPLSPLFSQLKGVAARVAGRSVDRCGASRSRVKICEWCKYEWCYYVNM